MASGLQPSRGRRSDPSVTRRSVGGPGHQSGRWASIRSVREALQGSCGKIRKAADVQISSSEHAAFFSATLFSIPSALIAARPDGRSHVGGACSTFPLRRERRLPSKLDPSAKNASPQPWGEGGIPLGRRGSPGARGCRSARPAAAQTIKRFPGIPPAGTLTLLLAFDAQHKVKGGHKEVLTVGPDHDCID